MSRERSDRTTVTRRLSCAASAWSFVYGLVGVYWRLGGAGYPFREDGPGSQFSLIAAVNPAVGATVIALLGFVGAAAALLMMHAHAHGLLRFALLAFAWIIAAVLLLVVPDARALVAAAYLPVALVAALIGHMPDDYRKAIPWPVLNQFVCIAGGLIWASAATAHQLNASRRLEAADGPLWQHAGWTAPAAAARWGRWCAWTAAIVPVIYAVTRWSWALGFPIGIDPRLLDRAEAAGGAWAGATLGTVAIVGAVLTLGLIQRWGERFPAWLPVIGGRSVPPPLAIVPASVVAVLATSAGLMFWRRTLMGAGAFTLSRHSWAALAPELLWPIWGAALGAATQAY
jgi:hypothetical protein